MPTLIPLWLALGDLSRRMRAAKAVSLACDYDGTLTPIVDHPDHARLDERTHEVLARLVALPGMRVAIVSGRRIDDLRAMLGLDGAFLVGTGGLETLTPDGGHTLHVQEAEALPPELKPVLGEWCARFAGSWLEDKGPAFSLHFRGVEPREQPAFASGVRRRVAPFGDRVRLTLGKKVFDVMPAVEWNKATALAAWLEAQRPPGLPLYLGDDSLDEPAYPAVTARGGYAVAVGRAASQARYALADPREVLWLLEWMEREWSRLVGAPGRARAISGV